MDGPGWVFPVAMGSVRGSLGGVGIRGGSESLSRGNFDVISEYNRSRTVPEGVGYQQGRLARATLSEGEVAFS